MNNNVYRKAQMPVVLRSMKIDINLKRYYWSKFNYLCAHNGTKYATEVFKTLRQVMMLYIDSPDRKKVYRTYFNACPVRKNGWLKKLFTYAEVQPIQVLQFLKLYTCVDEPVVTPYQAAEETDTLLSLPEMQNECDVPNWLSAFLYALKNKKELKHDLREYYNSEFLRQEDIDKTFGLGSVNWWYYRHLQEATRRAHQRGISYKTLVREQLSYVDKINYIMAPPPQEDWRVMQQVKESLPFHLSYTNMRSRNKPVPRDFDESGSMVGSNDSFDEDMMILLSLAEVWPEVSLVTDVLPDGLCDYIGEVNAPDEGEEFVGYIHQIPKKGTVVRRAIASPCRFLQSGMKPWQQFLRKITSKIPRNCQFNQTKFDGEIQSKLNHDFAGSVDLSKATDRLPLAWFWAIEENYFEQWFPIDPAESIFTNREICVREKLRDSRDLFYRVSRALWDNEGFATSWKRGQPLGTLPSFETLTITHWMVLEAISWSYDFLNSPYTLLGDDVIIFEPLVRKRYMSVLEEIDKDFLSRHKSYKGRLTEFAGTLFVRNQEHRHATDISYLSWTNLFDYQLATGVRVSYSDLPKPVKQRLSVCALHYHSDLRPQDLYTAMQWIVGVPGLTQVDYNESIGELITNFYRCADKEVPDLERGWYSFQFCGTTGMYRDELILPTAHRRPAKWWIKKYRPIATNQLAERCTQRH